MVDSKLIKMLSKLGPKEVLRHLDSLKDTKQKMICSLFFLEALTLKEIAAILDMRKKEVEGQFDNALKRVCIRLVE